MKFKTILIALTLVLLASFFTSLFMFGKLKHPEKAILGSWKEVSWHYELVDARSPKKNPAKTDPDKSLEHDIFSELVIHKSEKWNFSKNSGLMLEKANQKPTKLKWKLKGRGHILQLTYAGDTVENYQIQELTDKRMVLHFENDVHARGIVKIVFTKN